MNFQSRSKKTVIAGLFVALIALFGAKHLGWIDISDSGNLIDPPQTESGSHGRFREAPRFELKDAEGKVHRLEDFRGKVVLLHFWATWCPPCLEEIPHIVEVANEFKGRPLALVMVSLDQSWTDAHKTLPSKGLPPQVVSLLDPSGSEVPESYGSYQYPETYLLNGDLKIVTKWIGAQNWRGEQMQALLNKLLDMAEKKPAVK